jgi:hypothetical protein
LAILIVVASVCLLPANRGLADDSVEPKQTSAGLMDEEGSLERVFVENRRGLNLSGDVRAGYQHAAEQDRQGNKDRSDGAGMRWRAGANGYLAENVRAGFRIAALCSTDACNLSGVLEIQEEGVEDGDIVIDEAYIHGFRDEKFDLAIGRMQTKFVTKGGVFAKSLDRNDSSGTRVEWTDGFHGTYRHTSDWESHLIVQYNSADGASNTRRGPLDFSDNRARASYFASLVRKGGAGFLVQRALDFTYLPRTLQKDGTDAGRLGDYWALVARIAARWPQRSSGPRLRVSAEIGYAGNTQTNRAAGIDRHGDSGGHAWAVTASLMDFVPGHSIGLNYGHIESGWLLSSQYRNNDTLTEVRYVWQVSENLRAEMRARQRNEIDRMQDASQRREGFDMFLRFTWSVNRRPR